MGHPFQTNHLQEFIRSAFANAGLQAKQLAVVIQGFASVEESVEITLFGQKANVLFHRDVIGRSAKNRQATRSLVQQPQDHLDGGALAGTVGAQQAEDLTPADLKRDAVHRTHPRTSPEVTEDFGQS